MSNTGDTVTIGYKQYTITGRRTVEETEAAMPNLAAEMRKYGVVAEVTMKTPKSRKLWLANEFADGHLHIVLSVG
jgi:hypothetical protein